MLLQVLGPLALLTSALDDPFRDLGFDEARAAAKEEEKVVLVDFFTTWCAPCKKLDRTTWKDERVVAWLEEETVPLKIDAEKERELAKRYSVGSYPTLLFVDAEGEELGRLVGYVDAAGFLAKAPETLEGISELERVEEQLAQSPDDPMLRNRRGEWLEREGRHAEALEEYLWCFDHGCDHSLSYNGVRLSFLLSDLARLGAAYPPALEALRARERAAREHVLAGRSSHAVVVARLNDALGEAQRTLELWESLEGRAELERSRDALFVEVMDLLLAAERYEEVLEGAGDVVKRMESKLSMYRSALRLTEGLELAEEQEDHPNAIVRGIVVDEGSGYLRAAAATGRLELARELADLLIRFAPVPKTYATLAEAAAEVGAFELALDLLDRGHAATAADERGPLESARRRVERLRERAEREPQKGGERPEDGR